MGRHVIYTRAPMPPRATYSAHSPARRRSASLPAPAENGPEKFPRGVGEKSDGRQQDERMTERLPDTGRFRLS